MKPGIVGQCGNVLSLRISDMGNSVIHLSECTYTHLHASRLHAKAVWDNLLLSNYEAGTG